jgi:DNA-binding HxlR family transcriptional regulator
MRADRITSVVTEHGEVIGVAQDRQPGKSYGKGFMIVFLDAMEQAAERINSACTLKLLMRLPRHIDFTNFRPIRQVKLAEEIGVTDGAISRSMRELLELGLVERKGSGPRQLWRLSTDWGWNGSADQYHAFRGGRMKGKEPPAKSRGGEDDCRIRNNSVNISAIESGRTIDELQAETVGKRQRTLRLLTNIAPVVNDQVPPSAA